MSDAKPKRPGRESGRVTEHGENHSATAVPPDRAPVIAPEASPVPDATAVPRIVEREPETRTKPESPKAAAATPDDAWGALASVQAALARGIAEIAAEMSGMTRSSVAVAADAAIAMLGARTFSEAIEINAALARHGADAVIEGSAKLSEIGVAAMTEATLPILARLGAGWTSARPG